MSVPQETGSNRLIKIPRTGMRSWAIRHLKTVQNGLCPMCKKPIDMTIKGEGVIDHDHDTGQVRGVLHRSCNAAEGKIANAAARWGAKSGKYQDILEYLRSTIAYLEQPATNYIYPMHKSPEEKKDARSLKLKQRRAALKAALELRRRNASTS